MRRTTTLTIAATLLALGAAACSSSTPAADPKTPASQPSSAASTTGQPAPPATVATLDAAGVTQKLAKTIPTAKLTVTYDATSDPNARLGRPHQYTSKVAFDDSRVSNLPKAKEDAVNDRRDSISYGGTVEVFATPEDAEAWVKYVDGAQQALGGMIKSDYIYRNGAVVARVSHLLTPDQAKEYERAIS